MNIEELEITTCPICGIATSAKDLAEASWLPPVAVELLERRHPGWEMAEGACPVCVQETLMRTLLAQGESHNGAKNELAAPLGLNAAAISGVLPTPLRLHSDHRFTGRGVTMAMVDAGFYPHPDLVLPENRIRAWVDASVEPVNGIIFGRDEKPEWPDWDSGNPSQWHGLMTSAAAAGNGMLSHGLYRGLACEADLVLVQVRGGDGRIGNERITRALKWLKENGPELGVRVVSISVAGWPAGSLVGNPIDSAVADLVRSGVTVVVASGNDGARRLSPPATAPEALTIGGLDDKNNFDPAEMEVWHSNYGDSVTGRSKPELVAPSIWVAAPILPHTEVAAEAEALFGTRYRREIEVERRIAELKLLTPHYQHVEGTSFSAPLVASTVACMLQANPTLTPQKVREILIATAQPVADADRARQGAGAMVPALAIARALRERGGPLKGYPVSPHVDGSGVTLMLYDRDAQEVRVWGSWQPEGEPQLAKRVGQAGVWKARLPRLEPGSYRYRFVLDGARWIDDPENPLRDTNGFGGFDSILEVTERASVIEEKGVVLNDGPAFAHTSAGSAVALINHTWS